MVMTVNVHLYTLHDCLAIPKPSIPSSTTSPSLRYRGGFKPNPTPKGVPVEIISPGSQVMNWLI